MSTSALGDWHEHSSVRSSPRRMVDSEALSCGTLFFPPELAPWVQHPLLAARGRDLRAAALARHLFLYLDFTDQLEHEVVSKTVRRIATGALGVPCSVQDRMDAYKIYCDEAYHSLFSADLVQQIQHASGYTFPGGAIHPALDLFQRLGATLPVETRHWFELLFVTVSETLVSGSLERIPKALHILPAVREIVGDHLRDEIRHQSFFAHFIRLAWPCIPPSCQEKFGGMLPRFMLTFLQPNFSGISSFLAEHLTPGQVAQVMEESYPAGQMLDAAREASTKSRRILKACGILDVPAIREAFLESGLECNG